MKKILTFIIMVFITLGCMTSVFAGDLPETLLSSDEAQVYFGELKEVNIFSNDFKTIVKPVKNVKGDIALGTETEYVAPEFVGNFSAKAGNIYLFAYLDSANPLYIFEIDSYDTSTLKISKIKNNDMWQRFLEYLHEGKFEKAESERLERLGIEKSKEPVSLPPIKSYKLEFYALISILVASVAFFIYNKVSKKKL
ncbi:MAG: hypothetical protein E7398_04370 [Ruminococcaceae bacterium]|nr:hypothetical protein [Oscillospiraceae bacterium]